MLRYSAQRRGLPAFSLITKSRAMVTHTTPEARHMQHAPNLLRTLPLLIHDEGTAAREKPPGAGVMIHVRDHFSEVLGTALAVLDPSRSSLLVFPRPHRA